MKPIILLIELEKCIVVLCKSKVMLVNKIIKEKIPKLYKVSNSINKEMIHIRELEEINKNFKYHNEEYKELIKLLRVFVNEADNYLVKVKEQRDMKGIRVLLQ